ncbi:MAG TPA: carboxypeptidase M32 [Chloroflexota bacterium]
MGQQLERLKERLTETTNINRANAVLSWDQHTKMPPGGAPARAEQMATLARISHDLFTSKETGELLRGAAEETADLPYDSDDASLVRVAQRDYERLTKLPTELVAELRRHGAISHEVWAKARQEDDFAAFAPNLAKTIELSRRVAECLGYEDHPYDALLDQFEPGMKTRQVEAIFAELRDGLVPLVAAIAERGRAVDDAVLHQPFDEAAQEAFSVMAVERFGYDFSRGRLDRTVHPFATNFSVNDVRITTRYEPDFLNPALFGTMHEAGHAMYEQGVSQDLEGTPLARGASLGVHESQSRMWENVVGRGRAFWQHFYPQLQEIFPTQLGSTPLDDFYAAINAVHPSFIRVEADEVTYNLHIMVRFELELALLDGSLSVADAPGAWNDRMQETLGLTPPSDALGILQDVHWSSGLLGYFPTYTLGNILSIQLYEAACRARPTIPDELGTGEFDGLREWLTQQVYRHGRKYEPNELIERATGEPLQSRSYLAYLTEKFSKIYDL